MREQRYRTRTRIVALLAALCLTLTIPPLAAVAETSTEVREQAADAQVELDDLLQQMADGEARVAELQAEVDELADASIELQTSIIQSRDQLSRIVSDSYKSHVEARPLALLLSSRSMEELISQIYYAQKVSDWEADCIAQLDADKQALDERMRQLDAAKAEQDATLEALARQSEQLDATIAALTEKADRLEQEEREAEERRRAEEERRKAEEEARRAAEEARRAAEEARRKAEEAARKAAEEKARREEEERQRQEALAAAVASGDVEAVPTEGGGGWITCIASAYTIADNDPPGSTATASGIPLDESVPTVAMPMSMNPSRFYGSRIEISYNGMSVVATVTDCGYMGGGSRGLDLTPAIFRAFGFGSADAWGLRQVRYRFL